MSRSGSFTHLDKPVQYLKGIGPVRAVALARLKIFTARDLLYHVPRRYDDATEAIPIGRLRVGDDATAIGRVGSKGVIPTRSGLRIFQAVIGDESGMITAAWPGQPYLDRKIRSGDTILVSGPVKFFHGKQLQPREFAILRPGGEERRSRSGGEPAAELAHSAPRPEIKAGGPPPTDDSVAGSAPPGSIFATYPASDDVPQWVLRKAFENNLGSLLEWADDDEYLEAQAREARGLPGLSDALRHLHRPRDLEEVESGRRRLAFDELFCLQIVQARARRQRATEAPGIAHRRNNRLVRALLDSLPFELTGAQTRVLRDIATDMTCERRMSRLLQGDVGSGKTVVALFAMLVAVEGGCQAAIMAPTELLAEQHARTLADMLEPLELAPVLLTGRLGARRRREALAAIAEGAPVVVGTHALIQQNVEFRRLGLVVVDEQHRFGVRQRLALAQRGAVDDARPDLMVMSATPIPRSLAMAMYGDLDLSVLDELPKGRRPVTTTLRKPRDREAIYDFVRAELDGGRQAYIVYPLVAQSEKLDLLAAEDEYDRLVRDVFPDRRLGLLHGQLHSAEKDEMMRSFLKGETELLVATTVVEVGIDVPNSSVMVIEHAERFGLSQLHQLRGRVGRGAAESHCILVSDAGRDAFRRLSVLLATQDGFEVARADLRLRGQGDFFGSEQHGRSPVFRFADLLTDEDLLEDARLSASALVEGDPDLEDPAHESLRRLVQARYGDRFELFGVG